MFSRKTTKSALEEVVTPAVSRSHDCPVPLLFAFLEWVGHSWPDGDILVLGAKLVKIKWVPAVDDKTYIVKDTFDQSDIQSHDCRKLNSSIGFHHNNYQQTLFAVHAQVSLFLCIWQYFWAPCRLSISVCLSAGFMMKS